MADAAGASIDHELNHVLPSVQTVLPHTLHANLAAEYVAALLFRGWQASPPFKSGHPLLIQTTNGMALGLVGVGIVLPDAGNRRWHVHPRFRISLRSELAGDPAEDEAESLGSIASIISLLRHEWDHDKEGCRDVEQAYRNYEGVCRDIGNG